MAVLGNGNLPVPIAYSVYEAIHFAGSAGQRRSICPVLVLGATIHWHEETYSHSHLPSIGLLGFGFLEKKFPHYRCSNAMIMLTKVSFAKHEVLKHELEKPNGTKPRSNDMQRKHRGKYILILYRPAHFPRSHKGTQRMVIQGLMSKSQLSLFPADCLQRYLRCAAPAVARVACVRSVNVDYERRVIFLLAAVYKYETGSRRFLQ